MGRARTQLGVGPSRLVRSIPMIQDSSLIPGLGPGAILGWLAPWVKMGIFGPFLWVSASPKIIEVQRKCSARTIFWFYINDDK